MLQAASLQAEVHALEGMNLPSLRRFWQARWGEPPKLRARELMAYAVAYRLQAGVHGDLPDPLRRQVRDHARKFAADRRYAPAAGPRLAPGCSLIREWRGARHEVKVLEDGFSYCSERFTSLSQVAQHITGTKWNGRAFFGLKPKRQTPTKASVG